MAVLTLPDVSLSVGSGPSERARVLRKSLGDGYEQRASPGANSVQRRYTAVWTGVAKADAAKVVDFLRARAGVEAFHFTPPGESTAVRWTCEDWSGPTPTSSSTSGPHDVQAEFEEDFGL